MDASKIPKPVIATGEVVNLCEEDQPEPLNVNGHAVQIDELAVCDLCVSEDEGVLGRWDVRKRPAITVQMYVWCVHGTTMTAAYQVPVYCARHKHSSVYILQLR
eukprot:GHUV01007328.1.p1 GENE.GHUV01007328.1~~GHUV01007328.1.p1  ORF type:complete len:104 (+),score=12.24 GHUV01007328.1:821-1132(+)